MNPWKLAALTTWPRKFTDPRVNHPFRRTVKNYPFSKAEVDQTATLKLLRKELKFLEAKNVVLQIAVPAESITINGRMKENRNAPSHPGVIMSFDSKYGPLAYPADRFKTWQANVRAIAVSLENLRRVDRYGVTQTGEQYSGFKQIPAKVGGIDPHELVAGWAGWNVDGVKAEPLRALRLAKRAAHPDSEHGSEVAFKDVVAAGEMIG